MIKKIIKENIWYIITLVVLVILSIIVMRSSFVDTINKFDQSVIRYIITLVDDRLTTIFSFITNFGDLYIPIVILICIFIFVKNKWYFYLQAGSYLVAGGIAFVVKILAGRERPIEALIEIPSTKSFPSGHTLTSIVFYMMLVYLLTYHYKKKTRLVCFVGSFILIILIAISRIYLGVHYCSDVIGGIIFGVPCLLMLMNIINKNFKKNLK